MDNSFDDGEDFYDPGPTPAGPPPGDAYDNEDYVDAGLPGEQQDYDELQPPAGDGLDEAGDFDENGFVDTRVPVDVPAAFDSQDHRGGEVPYDFPGGVDAEPPSPALGKSTGSLPEEIEINTHGLIEETVQRLSFVHGVLGVLIMDRDGLIVHATMPMEEAAQLTGPTLALLSRARECAKLRPDDEFTMLTVRTRKHEMLFCSEANGAFAICVIQDPTPVQDQPPVVYTQVGGLAYGAMNGNAAPVGRS